MEDRRRGDLIRSLTTIGALVFGAWVLWFFAVVQRATRIGASRFAGAWEERIEALSFITFPPNAPVIALAAAAACAATVLAGPTQDLALAVLLRLVRWSATLMALIGVASVVTVLLGEDPGPDRVGSIGFRLAGVLLHVAVAYACLAAGRTAPGG